jgi:hypothetical protein
MSENYVYMKCLGDIWKLISLKRWGHKYPKIDNKNNEYDFNYAHKFTETLSLHKNAHTDLLSAGIVFKVDQVEKAFDDTYNFVLKSMGGNNGN